MHRYAIQGSIYLEKFQIQYLNTKRKL